MLSWRFCFFIPVFIWTDNDEDGWGYGSYRYMSYGSSRAIGNKIYKFYLTDTHVAGM